MPSQFYTKYIIYRLFLLMNSAVVAHLNPNYHKPNKVIQDLIKCLESSHQTSNLADKIAVKKYGSFYITYKQGRYLEIEAKKVEEHV
jgi:hypothetical protein